MSRNSRKELNGVYKRCLCVLNQDYKLHVPSMETVKRLEVRAAKEADWKKISNPADRERWIQKRVEELYSEQRARLAEDPNASLKAQIRAKMA